MKCLIIAEHDGKSLRPASRSCFTFIADVICATGGEVYWLILGHQIEEVAADAARFAPVLAIDLPCLAHPLADAYAQTIATIAKLHHFDLIAAASTTFARDVIPRGCAIADGAMASDVVGFAATPSGLHFECPQFAGAVIATIELLTSPRFITVRGSAFAPAISGESSKFSIEHIELDPRATSSRCQFVDLKTQLTSRPDVTEARIIVSGGRAIKNRNDLELLCGQLADILGGAVGCTRALVDAGIASSEQKVGQTGKIVAPELYFALGISGAVQHVAGMKSTRTIVAINSDPHAPIFEVADFGLVGDIYELVPELITKLATRLDASAHGGGAPSPGPTT